MRLLHALSIGNANLAHVWIANVVIRAISRMMLILSVGVHGRWVRKVVVGRDAGPWSTVVPAHRNKKAEEAGSQPVYSRTRPFWLRHCVTRAS